MVSLLIPVTLLQLFSLFNLLGIKKNLFYSQLFYSVIGIIVFFIFKKINRQFFRLNAHILFWFMVLLLSFTFIIGLEIKGSRRWVDLYFFNIQASEFTKVFFILFLSEFLSRSHRHIEEGVVFLLSFVYFFIPTFIIFKQPDLGNAVIFFLIYSTLVFFSPLSKKYILFLWGAVALIAPLSWLFLKTYQKQRLLSFLNPESDPQGTAYNMLQSVITVGSGEFKGRGLGLGTQSRLFFLPENHTDFAFSSLVEQFGFFGGSLVILLFLVLVFTIIKRMHTVYYQENNERSQPSSVMKGDFLYCLGFLSYFTSHIFMNIGMNLGLLPIAGITLPFISYGGSSLVTAMIGIALLPDRK